MTTMRVDVHQHIWTQPLLHALGERTAPPFVESSHGVTVLHTRAEQPYVIDVSLLAGCAPLLGERLRPRGGPPVEVRDQRIFYETSTYGRAAIHAMADVVGETQLLYGSDRPVVDPLPSSRDAVLEANAVRLFSRPEVAA